MKKIYFFVMIVLVSCATSSKKDEKKTSVDSTTISQDSVAAIRDKEINDELRIYNGHFEWHPEGNAEGSGSLSLTYNENREFTFSLSTSLNECGANLEGKLFADRSQHAAYQSEGCFIHFNFLAGDTVEVIEEECNKHPKGCGFAGDYVRMRE